MGSWDKEREIIYWLPSWAKQTQLRGLIFCHLLFRVRCLRARKETDAYSPRHFFPRASRLSLIPRSIFSLSLTQTLKQEKVWSLSFEIRKLFYYFVCEVKSKSYCVIYFIMKVVKLSEWDVISRNVLQSSHAFMCLYSSPQSGFCRLFPGSHSLWQTVMSVKRLMQGKMTVSFPIFFFLFFNTLLLNIVAICSLYIEYLIITFLSIALLF